MACRIVIQDRTTKKKVVHDYSKLVEEGQSEKDIFFDSKIQKKFYEAYVHKISALDPTIRVQRKIKCKTLSEAQKTEKKLIQTVTELIAKEESKGNTWGVILDLWKNECVKDYSETGKCWNPLTGKKIKHKTIINNYTAVKTYTKSWLDIPASELTRLHGKNIIRSAENTYDSYGSVRKLRSAIQSVYNFGIEEGIVTGVKKTPVCGVGITLDPEDSDPDILSISEVQTLLSEAKKRNHPWFPIWLHALSTGMRSSELYALRKDNVFLDRNSIKVSESWDWELDDAKETKAKYWRPAPIAEGLRGETERLISENEGKFLLPRFPEWERGEQAKVLRSFCTAIGIKPVKFHALRACFATHLLASGVDRATVMRIGGWKTFKSFEVYVRLSGIDEQGATDALVGKFLKDDQQVMNHVNDAFTKKAA